MQLLVTSHRPLCRHSGHGVGGAQFLIGAIDNLGIDMLGLSAGPGQEGQACQLDHAPRNALAAVVEMMQRRVRENFRRRANPLERSS